MDVKTVFADLDLNAEIYMEQQKCLFFLERK